MFATDRQIHPPGCPLCGHDRADHWHRHRERDFWCCRRCALVFVPPAQHLTAARERAEYDKHDNQVGDPGYRRFLAPAWQAVTSALPPGSRGLDFGCGPGPALAAMLEEAGYPTRLYDLYYRPDASVWRERYRFICLTEVIEHLADPAGELRRLWSHLEPGGRLVIQTQRVRDRAAFTTWRYTHDPTHIAFYAPATFDWLANWLGAAALTLARQDLAVLERADTGGELP